MTWFFTNINALANKLEEIEQCAISEQPEILLMVETWLSDNFDSNTLSIQGYDLFLRKDRARGRGGGLIGYNRIDSDLVICPINNIKINEVESDWFEISISKYSKGYKI